MHESPELHSKHSLSREFRELARLCREEQLSLRQIFWHVKDRGLALCILILGVPFLFPVPLPGLSVPFGILIVLLGVAYFFQRAPFLPKAMLDRPLPSETSHKIMEYAAKLFQYTEHWFRPRWSWMVESVLGRSLACLLIIGAALLLALPLPPGTNSPPASVIVATSIALLERDGLVMVFAGLLAVANVVLFGALFFLGYEAVHRFLF